MDNKQFSKRYPELASKAGIYHITPNTIPANVQKVGMAQNTFNHRFNGYATSYPNGFKVKRLQVMGRVSNEYDSSHKGRMLKTERAIQKQLTGKLNPTSIEWVTSSEPEIRSAFVNNHFANEGKLWECSEHKCEPVKTRRAKQKANQINSKTFVRRETWATQAAKMGGRLSLYYSVLFV
jgi:hypothetical protein